MTQDPYTELTARLGIERTEAKKLVLANLYGPGFDFSAVEQTVADAMKCISGGEDAPWPEDEDSHPMPTESGSGAASENHMSLETIKAITGDDSVRARMVSDGGAGFVDVKTLYADFVSESRAGKAAFTRFLGRVAGGADETKEAGA